jgi:hypothetical protein
MSYCSPVSTVAIVLDPSLLFTRPNTKRYAYPLFVTDNLNCQLIVVTVSCISDCNTVQIAFETSALQFRKVDLGLSVATATCTLNIHPIHKSSTIGYVQSRQV